MATRGFNALAGVEGFMKGWEFGQGILREGEAKGDREQARKDAATERQRGTERYGREVKDAEYKEATREAPESVLAGRALERKAKEQTLAAGGEALTAAQRTNRQAPTDEEARTIRQLGIDSTRADITVKQSTAAKNRADAAATSKKDKDETDANKKLAAFDYLVRNKQLYDPAKIQSISRSYQALKSEDFSKVKPGDLDAAASVISEIFDKSTEFQGKPIVERSAKVVSKGDKIVLLMNYKVKNPDGTVVDAEGGPLPNADVVREIADDEALQLLAGHNLIGQDIQRMVGEGLNPQQAIAALRSQIIQGGGKAGLEAVNKIDPTEDEREYGSPSTMTLGGQELSVQGVKGKPLDDSALIVGGSVEVTDKDGKLTNVPVRTVGEAKQALGLTPAPATPAAAPVTVATQAQVAALPKGAKFIFNGKEYVKK